jgi:hypothetical protein
VIPLRTVILNVQNPISKLKDANVDSTVLENGEPVDDCARNLVNAANDLSAVTIYRID